MSVRSLLAVVATVAVAASLTTGPAASSAAALLSARDGYDVSYPQCGSALPSDGGFAVVGVDGGRPFDPNPCLAELIAWANTKGKPAYYVNTANPGPKLSAYWPLGQTSPRHCTRSRPDSEACAFNYGWNAAKDSLRRAKAAARSVGAPTVLRATWWLDVETHNTWESLEYGETRKYLRNDAAVLAGMRALLKRRGVDRVGVYSTVHQWQRITGGASLGRAPIWYAGVGSRREAVRHCRPRFSFTGGRIRLAQYAHNGFDANVRC